MYGAISTWHRLTSSAVVSNKLVVLELHVSAYFQMLVVKRWPLPDIFSQELFAALNNTPIYASGSQMSRTGRDTGSPTTGKCTPESDHALAM